MARQKQKRIEESEKLDLKFTNQLVQLLDRLHDVGTERDRAGNRKLHMDHYCLLIFTFLFNPVVTSLRGMQQASELKKVQKKLGCPRTSLGSLSEATDVFDPAPLREIARELGEQLEPIRDASQGHVKHLLTAVDGSVQKTLATIATAAYQTNRFGEAKQGWRLHTHFDIDRHVPTRIDITPGVNGGKSDEKNVLRDNLAPNHCYIMDRWYAQFLLFNEIHRIHSSYVCRIRDNSDLSQVVEERPLSEEAQAAGVLSDAVIQMGSGGNRTDHPVRIIQVSCSAQTGRGRRNGGRSKSTSDGILRIATNLLDVPPEIIAEIYRHRWLIEMFFKFLKHLLGCRHLLSTDPVGIEIQVYCAIIACMLISLWTGRKPTLRTYEMICFYFMGWASEEELITHIEKLKRHDS